MANEKGLRKSALLDWTHEMIYQQQILYDPEIPSEQKVHCEERIAESKDWIARIYGLIIEDDGSATDLKKDVSMAKKIDTDVNYYTEYGNGFHFIIREHMYDISDPGFAIAKKDGQLYRGFEAHEVLKGDIVSEGEI